MNFLLFKLGRTRKTGKTLARLLGLKAISGFESCARVGQPDKLIRWGNSDDIVISPPPTLTLNSAEAVRQAGNKRRALEILAAANVAVPKFVTSAPAIGRKTSHQQGLDIRVYGENELLVGSDYYLEIIPSEREYRVHVVQGKVICTQLKVPENNQVECYLHQQGVAHADCLHLRNHSRGWRFKRIQPRDRLSKVAISAVQALGLDFGAADIIKDSRDGKYKVLEVNTAPALELTTLDRYVEEFRRILNA